MKKIVIVILALVMTFLFISCGNIEIKIQDQGENEKEEQTEAEMPEDNEETIPEGEEINLWERYDIAGKLYEKVVSDYAGKGIELDSYPDIYGMTKCEGGDNLWIVFYYVYDTNEKILALTDCSNVLGETTVEYDDMYFIIDGSERSLETTYENGIAVLKNEEAGEKLTVDFENGTYEHEFSLNEKSIDHTEESPDKKYSLITLNNSAFFDNYKHNILLQNNETGEIRYLTTLYGYNKVNGEVGFLKNGDIYEYNRETLKVYSPETLEVIFDINDNFKLGTMENGNNRWLYSFRRDPDDFTYTIVYAYFNKEGGYDTWEAEGYDCYYTNYRIGFLDKDGNILESYDTYMAVCGDELGYFDVSMRFSDDAITLIAIGNTEEKITTTGVFDMKTKYFTVDRK